ncbi:Microtubule-associated protein futsch [Eumeta japonica]|uniref:Microtubule-associated protein futsch n=1 Tax=Eumeta variegata TaxID=151549 RepID=A0A4C1TXG2_EUMVA|nr:Microtubule-associated protein futsch [Eumeta japonica]
MFLSKKAGKIPEKNVLLSHMAYDLVRVPLKCITHLSIYEISKTKRSEYPQLAYLEPYVAPASLEQLLVSSDVVGNIRFSHPTLYVFPGGQGDAALFGINGFNMLERVRRAASIRFTVHLALIQLARTTRSNFSSLLLGDAERPLAQCQSISTSFVLRTGPRSMCTQGRKGASMCHRARSERLATFQPGLIGILRIGRDYRSPHVDGGFSRKACWWDFARHLDRLDAVLLTRLNNCSAAGMAAVLRRKATASVYPQIGHFFCNLEERRALASPDGAKDDDPLSVSLLQEGSDMMADLRHINLKPQHCYRSPEPINLYHKVGHGKP